MSQPENTKKSRKEMQGDKKRLKDEKKIAKARIRAERERGGSQSSLLSSKSDRSKKAHEEKLKRQKKARASAGDIASFIGYDAVYKDGIAQVEEGLFSQTIEFSDISYQSARRENQQNIFTVLSSLYNYFGADSCSSPLRTSPSLKRRSERSASSRRPTPTRRSTPRNTTRS